MPLQPINYGAAANDGTGDSLREALRKSQVNFDYLDLTKADAQAMTQALAGKVSNEAGKSLMEDAERAKLTGIATGAQVNVAANLGLGTATANSRIITSSTGASVTLPAATSSNAGLMTAAESVKLGTVATNASANSNDAFLLSRVNHSGTQPLSTITGTGTAAAMNALGVGGIIERGSNANGEYVRFADGTQICWRPPQKGYAANTTIYKDWPAAFVATPIPIFNPIPYGERDLTLSAWCVGVVGVEFASSVGSAVNEIRLGAAGRWK